MNPQPNPPLDAADREDWTEAFRYLALIMLVVLGGAVVVYTSAAIKPLIISGLVAYVLSTIVDGLRKVTHLSRQTLVVIVYFTSLAAFLLLPALLAPTLVRQSQEIYADLQFSFVELRTAVLQPIQTPSGALYIGDIFPGIAQLSLSSLLPSSATIIELLQTTSTNLAWTVMIVVTTYTCSPLNAAPYCPAAAAAAMFASSRMTWRTRIRSTFAGFSEARVHRWTFPHVRRTVRRLTPSSSASEAAVAMLQPRSITTS